MQVEYRLFGVFSGIYSFTIHLKHIHELIQLRRIT